MQVLKDACMPLNEILTIPMSNAGAGIYLHAPEGDSYNPDV